MKTRVPWGTSAAKEPTFRAPPGVVSIEKPSIFMPAKVPRPGRRLQSAHDEEFPLCDSLS